MEFYSTTSASPSFTGDILVLPIVSTGNVAQLAADLILSTFGLSRIGVFSSQYFVPAVAGREDSQDGITLPFELYGKEGIAVKVLQQRTPVLKAYKDEFVNSLLAFIEGSKFGALLILTGIDLSDRRDPHMFAPTFHLILTLRPARSSASTTHPVIGSLQSHVPPFLMRDATEDQNTLDTLPAIPGSGLTRRILSSVPRSFSVPIGVILEYVLEGDNRQDAQILAAATVQTIQKELGATGSEVWEEPSSWKQGLFGATHDQTLYG